MMTLSGCCVSIVLYGEEEDVRGRVNGGQSGRLRTSYVARLLKEVTTGSVPRYTPYTRNFSDLKRLLRRLDLEMFPHPAGQSAIDRSCV